MTAEVATQAPRATSTQVNQLPMLPSSPATSRLWAAGTTNDSLPSRFARVARCVAFDRGNPSFEGRAAVTNRALARLFNVTKIQKTKSSGGRSSRPSSTACCARRAPKRLSAASTTTSFEPGTYRCAGCGAELFVADTKYDSGCGWPAFYAPAAHAGVDEETDTTTAWCAPR